MSVFETGKNMTKIINVELNANERDFIIDLIEYALLDDLIRKLKRAKPNKENIINVRLDGYDLEQLIGNLSLEANHNKKRSIQESACEIAEMLESYELQLKRLET
jgi:hypothetical protein